MFFTVVRGPSTGAAFGPERTTPSVSSALVRPRASLRDYSTPWHLACWTWRSDPITADADYHTKTRWGRSRGTLQPRGTLWVVPIDLFSTARVQTGQPVPFSVAARGAPLVLESHE
eukprot:6321672-Prymnesium_polylepis.2